MIMKLLTLIALLLFSTSLLEAQQDVACKVLLTEIAGIYDGQCKD